MRSKPKRLVTLWYQIIVLKSNPCGHPRLRLIYSEQQRKSQKEKLPEVLLAKTTNQDTETDAKEKTAQDSYIGHGRQDHPKQHREHIAYRRENEFFLGSVPSKNSKGGGSVHRRGDDESTEYGYIRDFPQVVAYNVRSIVHEEVNELRFVSDEWSS